ncbi:hypothetical protein Syun_029035 [Stephania yunnanensis]|uniref:DUF7806 domain-containing protein n=1 Tax=Stephania yunnanensis TaxID=152371 RepID=A0AAP0HJF7_9MAGN
MEALYARLYEKYMKLKARNNDEIDQFNHEQESRFMNYVSAAEDLIEHLRSENDRLKAHINDLTNEVASVRSEKVELHAKYDNLLLQESEKTKELSEELKRLQSLQEEGLCCNSKQGNKDNGKFGSPHGVNQISSQDKSKGSSRKKRRLELVESQTEEDSPPENVQQPNCCMAKTTSSGCTFQTLMEWLVGLKFASVSGAEGLCLSVCHQSSGYSFNLTWVIKASGEEAELLYHAASLGTFDKVAPDWMKEDIIFSTTMCPLFFKRLSRVLGLYY